MAEDLNMTLYCGAYPINYLIIPPISSVGDFDAYWADHLDNPMYYYAQPPIAESPTFGPKQYRDVTIDFPGVNGTFTKRLGWRNRPISATLMAVGASVGTATTRAKKLIDDMNQLNRYTVVLPANNFFYECKLASATITSYINTGLGAIFAIVPTTWVQLSDPDDAI